MTKHLATLCYSLILLFSASVFAESPVNVEAPLVSATELDTLSPSTIIKRYPQGVSVQSSNLSPALKKKLEEMQRSGYEISFVKPDMAEFQVLTQQVIKKNGISRFLIKAYGENPGCSVYFQQEFIPYAMRKEGASSINSIRELEQQSTEALKQVYQNHHGWRNIGFTGMDTATSSITTWINSAAQATESISKAALKDCRVSLKTDQLKIVSQMITLDYLTNAVKGQFYHSLGVPLTHYRLMALESLGSLKK